MAPDFFLKMFSIMSLKLRVDDLIERLDDAVNLLEGGLSAASDLSEQLGISSEDLVVTLDTVEKAIGDLEDAYVYLNDILDT